MKSHALQTRMMVQLLIAGAMGWALMACTSPEETTAQRSQADTWSCTRNSDCPPGYFCDGGQEVPACFEYGNVCGGADHCGVEFELGEPETGNATGDEVCGHCFCWSREATFDGDMCAPTYEEAVSSCEFAC
jgi:hypothetical protein